MGEACLKPNAASANPTNASVEGSGTSVVIGVMVPEKRPSPTNDNPVMKAVVDKGLMPALVSMPKMRNRSTPFPPKKC